MENKIRNTQEILNIAIASGMYKPQHLCDDIENESWYMCDVLGYLEEENTISYEEMSMVKEEIRKYLGKSCTLLEALTFSGFPNEFRNCLDIYRDWDSRPELDRFKTK